MAIGSRELLFQAFGGGTQVGASLLERYACLHPANATPIVIASPPEILQGHVQGNPEVGIIWTAKPRRHHTNNRVGSIV